MTNPFKRKSSERNTQERALPERVLLNSFTPGPPGVNIIPSDVLTSYADNRLRTKFIAVAVSLAAVGCLGFVGSSFAVNNSQSQLQELQAEYTALQAQTVELSPGKQYIDTLNAKRQTLATKVSRDIAYSKIISELNAIGSANNTKLTNISIDPLIPIAEEGGGDSSACPSPDPFGGSSGIACISFSAESDTDFSANTFASALETQSNIFTNVFVTNMSRGKGADRTNINGSVLATTGAMTSRFEGLNQDLYAYFGASSAPETVVEETPITEEEVTP